MKSVSSFKNVFLHKEPVDMRKAINGLCEIVQLEGMGNLMDPSLFVFTGRDKSKIKVLYFDQSGFCLWQKRLEKDKFKWPRKMEGEVLHWRHHNMSCVIAIRFFEFIHDLTIFI
jgi:transposase